MKRRSAPAMVLLVLVAAGALAEGQTEQESVADTGRWQDEYPTIVFSSISSENESDRIARAEHLIEYLEEQLDVEVEFFAASDYAGTIEAMKAGRVDFAGYGTASYVRAYMVTEGNVEPLVTALDEGGTSGYHSTIWVRADSPYESVEDLEGKPLAFADPNSTSGYLVPSFYLRRAGMDPDAYFESGFSGNHEMGILALVEGTYEGACTWYTNERRSNPLRMAEKGMIDMDDIRMIWKSPVITNGPIACRSDLPEQMKRDFQEAMVSWIENDPQSYEAYLAPSPMGQGYMAVTHERYLDFLEMVRLNDAAREG
ncbi:MAG: phosphate/phosphite/phosphonate ABC transporter substrate-binding protein [Spirochaetota bacterium]